MNSQHKHRVRPAGSSYRSGIPIPAFSSNVFSSTSSIGVSFGPAALLKGNSQTKKQNASIHKMDMPAMLKQEYSAFVFMQQKIQTIEIWRTSIFF